MRWFREDSATDPAGTSVFRMMKRMTMLSILGVLGGLGLAMPMIQAQNANADPAAVIDGRTSDAKRAQDLPVISIRWQRDRPIGGLVMHLREEVMRLKGAKSTVNIILGPDVAELKVPADLDLVNVTPLGVFAAIASVDPRLTFAPVSTPGSEMTITLQLRPDAKTQGAGKDIKLRIFRPPPLPKTLESDEDRARKQQAEALKALNRNLDELLRMAEDLRRQAGGDGISKNFSFRIHSPTRTVLVTGTAEDLDLAQEVLMSLGATPASSGHGDDSRSGKPDGVNKPVRTF